MKKELVENVCQNETQSNVFKIDLINQNESTFSAVSGPSLAVS